MALRSSATGAFMLWVSSLAIMLLSIASLRTNCNLQSLETSAHIQRSNGESKLFTNFTLHSETLPKDALIPYRTIVNSRYIEIESARRAQRTQNAMDYPPEYTGTQTPMDYPPKYPGTQNLTDYKTEYPKKRHAEGSQHALGPLDHEMLSEAESHEGHQSEQQVHSEEHEEAELDQSLSWIRHAGGLHEARNGMDLVVPVVVPQTAPGIKNPFSRAWSPLLTDHGVLPQDFLAFIDHLNVCKAASPPLQLLNLAGTIVGFTPVPFAWAINMGVSVASTAGIVAVSRVRIARYIERANKEYFHPRGLQARIAKQNTLPELVHQDSRAPILAPIPPNASFDSFPSLRDRRLMALGNHIAPIHFEASADVTTEGNMLDKLSAKMTARSAAKSERKMMGEHMKQQEDDMKDSMKIQKDLQKARRKGKFADAAKLEVELQQLQGGVEGAGKEWKVANKFLFVVVQSLKQVQAAAAQHHEVPQGLRWKGKSQNVM